MSISGAQTLNAPRFDDTARAYDALLVLSFGGPEGPDDVIPFLENVTRGRNVPRERLDEVAEHYLHFGGVSPINAQNRALIAALEPELRSPRDRPADLLRQPQLAAVRHRHVRQMRADGVKRALVFVTSALQLLLRLPSVPRGRHPRSRRLPETEQSEIAFDKLRVFYNHPGFIEPMADRSAMALGAIPHRAARPASRSSSPPTASRWRWPRQRLRSRNCARRAAWSPRLPASPNYRLAYQSRSGSADDPLAGTGHPRRTATAYSRRRRPTSIVVPIGFISDHMEVLFDLDAEAAEKAAELGHEDGPGRAPSAPTRPSSP